MKTNNYVRNRLVIIAILILALTLVISGGGIFAVISDESPSFTETITMKVTRSNDPAIPPTYDILTPPLRSGDFMFGLKAKSPDEICTLDNICFRNGERKTIVPYIDAQMVSRGLTEADDTTVSVDFLLFINADEALDIVYEDTTGVQHNSDFSAPVIVNSRFSQKMNIGAVSESRSLLLEGASQGQIIEPKIIAPGNSATFTIPIDTTSFGINEVKMRPYVRFSREDRFFDVGTKKVLFVNFKVSPLIEGQELPQGSIGINIDPDSPIQRLFIQPTQDIIKNSETSPLIFLFVIGIGSIIILLLIQIFNEKRKRR